MSNVKKKITGNSLSTKINNKPSTVMRAGITANQKFSRGKQLVEHAPFSLIPDPQNPRPGEIIDDAWLLKNLKLATENSLCRYDQDKNEYHIPNLEDLDIFANDKLKDSYNYLRDLAHSIRIDGLISPIEIFLTDRDNDPEYFVNTDKEFGYVILEGHQRRLAALMAGVDTVTCIELTDEASLAKLKVKHRKLRRQLSENNLRKNLTISQNIKIIEQLILNDESLTSTQLSSITGINVKSCEAALKLLLNKAEYPKILFSFIYDDKISMRRIRELVYKSYDDIEAELKGDGVAKKTNSDKKVKSRGSSGGRVKKTVSFKVQDQKETHHLLNFLYRKFPEIKRDGLSDENEFKCLEEFLNRIKKKALEENI